MGICTSKSQKNLKNMKIQLSDFTFVRMMGRGTYGCVWKVADQNQCLFALKIINKIKIICNKSVKATMTEKRILTHLTQAETEFIVKLHASFQDQQNLYLLMDFFEGESLRTYLNQGVRMEQQEIYYLSSCILRALVCLRFNNIIHRDIKPENIIIGKNGDPLLIDFGISSFYFQENAEYGGGSIGYMAPELILQQNHGFEVDYFSFGILIFELFFGKRPYMGSSRPQFMKEISKKPMNLQNFQELSSINGDARDFIMKLLERKPYKRLGHNGISELTSHKWMVNNRSCPVSSVRAKWSKLLQQQPKQTDFQMQHLPCIANDQANENVQKSLRLGYLQQLFKDFDYLPCKSHIQPTIPPPTQRPLLRCQSVGHLN